MGEITFSEVISFSKEIKKFPGRNYLHTFSEQSPDVCPGVKTQKSPFKFIILGRDRGTRFCYMLNIKALYEL